MKIYRRYWHMRSDSDRQRLPVCFVWFYCDVYLCWNVSSFVAPCTVDTLMFNTFVAPCTVDILTLLWQYASIAMYFQTVLPCCVVCNSQKLAFSVEWAPSSPLDNIRVMVTVWSPLTSNRHHLSYDDCLENKGRLQDCSCSIGSYHCIQCYAHIYEQLLQVKQICLCLTGFTSLCLDAYVFLCSLVFHCMHVVLL